MALRHKGTKEFYGEAVCLNAFGVWLFLLRNSQENIYSNHKNNCRALGEKMERTLNQVQGPVCTFEL